MVAIIGILAAVAIPQYQNYVARAQVTEALSLASGVKVAVTEYLNTNGTFPTSNTEAGIDDSGNISGKYVISVAVANGGPGTTGDGSLITDGVIFVTFKDAASGAHSLIAGGLMALVPINNGGSVSWFCMNHSSAVDLTKYLPSSCTLDPLP